jgi:hypothetical protein
MPGFALLSPSSNLYGLSAPVISWVISCGLGGTAKRNFRNDRILSPLTL